MAVMVVVAELEGQRGDHDRGEEGESRDQAEEAARPRAAHHVDGRAVQSPLHSDRYLISLRGADVPSYACARQRRNH